MAIDVDEDPVPTCTQAIVALDAGDVAAARRLLIQAATEMRDLREDHARLSRRSAAKGARLIEARTLFNRPLED